MLAKDVKRIVAEAKEKGDRAGLSGAYLRGADLSGAIGNGREIKSIQGELFSIVWIHDTEFNDQKVWIGCTPKLLIEWKAIDSSNDLIRINNQNNAWERLSPLVFALIEASPAVPTKPE